MAKKERKTLELNMSEEAKQSLKDKIITEIYNSGIIQQKVDGICHRNKISKDTHIHEDVLQETFYYLSKYPIEELAEMYYDNPNRIIGLAVWIAVHKGVIKHSKFPNYHRHSIAQHILFASNLRSQPHQVIISPTEVWSEGEDTTCMRLVDETTCENDPIKELFELIRSELTLEQMKDLDYFLNFKKTRGKFKKEIQDKKNALQESIKTIVEKHQINL